MYVRMYVRTYIHTYTHMYNTHKKHKGYKGQDVTGLGLVLVVTIKDDIQTQYTQSY